jgi:acetoacetate decarboxylase
MNSKEIRSKAFAMPFQSPSYPKGPYRFIDREYFIITYETDMDKLKRLIPEPLEVREPLVNFEIIRMPNSTGFGDYTESGQVVPIYYQGKKGTYSLAMFLNDHSPIVGGREIWGFPKKRGNPVLKVSKDTLIGHLKYEGIRIATATMGYKNIELDKEKILQSLSVPNYLLKIIPHVDGSLRVCELVSYTLEDITIKDAWTAPASLDLYHHALAPIAELPVKRVVSSAHILTDLTLPYGKVIWDYLKEG